MASWNMVCFLWIECLGEGQKKGEKRARTKPLTRGEQEGWRLWENESVGISKLVERK